MIKLTRLNRSVVAINPDHIAAVDVSPDTTLCMLGGDKIIVRESLDELIGRVVAFRRALRTGDVSTVASVDADVEPSALETVAWVRRVSSKPPRPSRPPRAGAPRTTVRPDGGE